MDKHVTYLKHTQEKKSSSYVADIAKDKVVLLRMKGYYTSLWTELIKARRKIKMKEKILDFADDIINHRKK